MGLLAVVVVSCTKNHGADSKPVAPRFSVNLNITDGQRTLDRVVDYSKVSVGIVSSNEVESYTFTYQIDGGADHVITKMFNGMNRSLNAAFRDYVNYGGYRLTGCVVIDSNPEQKVLVDTVVWMKYVPLDYQHLVAVVKGDRIVLNGSEENCFNTGDGGTLELTFLPPDSYADIACVSSNPDVFLVDGEKAKTARGVFSIPFTALSAGETNLSFVFVNGPDCSDVSFIVKVLSD